MEQRYWAKRIEEQMRLDRLRSNRENTKALSRIYTQAQEDCVRELTTILAKIEADKQGGVVMANDLYRTNTYYSLLDFFQSLAKDIGSKQYTITDNALIDIYNQAQQTITELLPKDAIRSQWMNPSLLTPQDIVRQSWCIDGKNFSDRIWSSKEALINDMPKTLLNSLSLGKSSWSVAQDVAERLAVDERNAFRLVRTETAHFQVRSQTDKYKSYGFTHGRYLGTDCCGDCASLNGKVFTLDEIQTLIPKHPNCTCSFEVVTK